MAGKPKEEEHAKPRSSMAKPKEAQPKKEVHDEAHKKRGNKFATKAPHTGYIDHSKMVYKGKTKHGKAEGAGECTWPSGDTYKGAWKENKMHGTGEFSWKDKGCTYKGEYAEGWMHGFGTMTIPGEGVYEGQFEHGQRHGVGTWTSANSTYQGEYVKGKREGLGTLETNDGSSYEGTWKDGLFHGEGVWTWADKRRFEGVFKADRPLEGVYHEFEEAKNVRWDRRNSRFIPIETKEAEEEEKQAETPETHSTTDNFESEALSPTVGDERSRRTQGALMQKIGRMMYETASCTGLRKSGRVFLPSQHDFDTTGPGMYGTPRSDMEPPSVSSVNKAKNFSIFDASGSMRNSDSNSVDYADGEEHSLITPPLDVRGGQGRICGKGDMRVCGMWT
mmetsp:Transcript_51967/g.123064  ORF Transcript_51967/g.123064 Transcript_51967/m.123064 type:complete len:391 (+) Transcript_51967:85-1257(+)